MATTSVLVVNTKTVRLTVGEMLNGGTYQIVISDVTDVDGNPIAAGQNPKTFTGIGIAPQVSSATHVAANQIDLVFNEEMESTLLDIAGNFSVTGATTPNVSAAAHQADGVTTRLTLDADLQSGTPTYTVAAVNVTDVAGNLIDSDHDTASFTETIKPFRDNATLATDLISYYKLNGNLTDSHTNGYNGAWYNASGTSVPGKISTAYAVADITQAVAIPHNDTFDNATNMSMSAWIYIASPLAEGFWYNVCGRKRNFQMSVIADAGAYFGHLFVGTLRTGSFWLDLPGASDLPLDAWVHVACTYGTVYARLYINGVLNAETANGGLGIIAEASTEPIVLGAGKNAPGDGGAYYGSLRGSMDEIGFWSRELNATEVGNLCNTGSGLSY
jgi:hypothetical protein